MRDLLRRKSTQTYNLRVREHPKDGPYVEGQDFLPQLLYVIFVFVCLLMSTQLLLMKEKNPQEVTFEFFLLISSGFYSPDNENI